MLTPLSAANEAYIITENGVEVGRITKGSAVVTLPAAFTDRLESGTHNIAVFFTDNLAANRPGSATLVVARGDSGANPGAGEPISPATGDAMNMTLWLALAVLALAALTTLTVRRRKGTE